MDQNPSMIELQNSSNSEYPPDRRRLHHGDSLGNSVGGQSFKNRKGTNVGFIKVNKIQEFKDSITEVDFKVEEFLKTFFYETFGILLLPFILFKEGMNGAKNRAFIPKPEMSIKAIGFLTQMLYYSLFVVMNVIFWIWWDQISVHYSVVELIMMDLAVLVRNAIIGVKWAMISNDNLRRLKSEDIDMKRDVQHRQIITGWVNLDDEIIPKMINTSSLQTGIDLTKLNFTFDEQNSQLNKVLEESIKLYSGEKGDVDIMNKKASAFYVGTQFLLQDRKPFVNHLLRLCTFFGALHGLIAIIVNLIAHHNYYKGIHPAAIVVIICQILLSFTYYSIDYGLLLGGVMDFYRRSRVMRYLSEITREGFPSVDETKLTIDFGIPQNIVAWISLRKVMQNFGYQYYIRITFYTGFFVGLIVSMLIYLYVNLLQGYGADIKVLVILCYDFTIIGSAIITMGVFGYIVNGYTLVHLQHLIQEKLIMTNLLSAAENGLDEMERRNLKLCVDLINTAIQTIEVDDTRCKIKIIGYEASGSMFTPIIGIIFTMVFAVSRFFTTGQID